MAQPASSAMPIAMIVSLPKRAISAPVKKLGAEHAEHMPLDAKRRVVLAEAAGNHGERCRGHHQAHQRVGSHAADHRHDEARLAGDLAERPAAGPALVLHARCALRAPPRKSSDHEPERRQAATWRKRRRQMGSARMRSRVKMTVCGPMIAAAMPPTSTQEIARARNAGDRRCRRRRSGIAGRRNSPGRAGRSRARTGPRSCDEDHRQAGDDAAEHRDHRAEHEADAPADPRASALPPASRRARPRP